MPYHRTALGRSDFPPDGRRQSRPLATTPRPRLPPLPHEALIPRQHDVQPAAQWSEAFRQRLPRLPTHDDGVHHSAAPPVLGGQQIGRYLPEESHVAAQPPWQRARLPDPAVAGGGDDEGDIHGHFPEGAKPARKGFFPATRMRHPLRHVTFSVGGGGPACISPTPVAPFHPNPHTPHCGLLAGPAAARTHDAPPLRGRRGCRLFHFARAARRTARAELNGPGRKLVFAESLPCRLASGTAAVSRRSALPACRVQHARRFISDAMRSRFDNLLKENKLVVFMKGTPESPRCGFSGAVVQMLEVNGACVSGSRAPTSGIVERAAQRKRSLRLCRGAPVCRTASYAGVELAKLKTVDVLADDEVRSAIKEYSHWPTVPQIYLNGDFLGGCDTLYELHKEGCVLRAHSKLEELLVKEGLIPPLDQPLPEADEITLRLLKLAGHTAHLRQDHLNEIAMARCRLPPANSTPARGEPRRTTLFRNHSAGKKIEVGAYEKTMPASSEWIASEHQAGGLRFLGWPEAG
ncbi:MAG: hypothetical protein BJ554DRAFT_583, partial [Olpidium bornovanus]